MSVDFNVFFFALAEDHSGRHCSCLFSISIDIGRASGKWHLYFTVRKMRILSLFFDLYWNFLLFSFPVRSFCLAAQLLINVSQVFPDRSYPHRICRKRMTQTFHITDISEFALFVVLTVQKARIVARTTSSKKLHHTPTIETQSVAKCVTQIQRCRLCLQHQSAISPYLSHHHSCYHHQRALDGFHIFNSF